MDRTAFTFDTIQRLRLVRNPKELMTVLAEVGEQFGFAKACAIASVPRANRNFAEYCYAERWPAGWHERYLERRYLGDDPVIKRLRQGGEPFAWHEVAVVRDKDNKAAAIMGEAGEFELRAGFNVPIQAVKGELATVVFAGDRFDLAWEDRPALLLIAIYAHDKMRELMGVRPMHPQQQRPLTPREIEVLKWTAEGKTSQDIADILSVSLPTVQSHIANLCRKLDVVTRAQATARAVRWGILS
jgi:LuxR family quorum sensing-dependent transcriptional regulator